VKKRVAIVIVVLSWIVLTPIVKEFADALSREAHG